MAFTRKSSSHPRFLPALVCIAAFLLIAGCAVGPNFQKPAAPNVSGYTAKPLSAVAGTTNVVGGQPQQFVEGMDIPGEWWTLFHSPQLNDLIERALTNNPNIMAAQAALAMAHENTLAQNGAFWPSASASFSASRQKTSEQLSTVPFAQEFYFNLFTPQVSVSYVPDVFGLNRRTVESLQAQEEQQRFALLATYITLSANVAAAAIQEASLQAQIDATRQIIAVNTNMLRILRNQYAMGYTSQLAVAAQEAQLAQAEAALPPLLSQLDQQRDLLAVLAGNFPGNDSSESFKLSDLQLPEELPVSLPSQLVEQRPDVRQAEENLHSASAQIGVALANRLPNVTLTANAGSTALTFDKIFSSGTGFWGIGAAATQPIFEGGTLMHKERAARAAYVQAADQYRSTVLTAFQNVADTLNALEHDGDAVTTAAAAADAAKVSLDITQRQLQTGYTNYLAALSAELTYEQAVVTLAQAQANRYSDTAALFQALGGGWWNQKELSEK
jgi:NodT family efflux transporter outer membrane factor (OMF) lipoprotein